MRHVGQGCYPRKREILDTRMCATEKIQSRVKTLVCLHINSDRRNGPVSAQCKPYTGGNVQAFLDTDTNALQPNSISLRGLLRGLCFVILTGKLAGHPGPSKGGTSPGPVYDCEGGGILEKRGAQRTIGRSNTMHDTLITSQHPTAAPACVVLRKFLSAWTLSVADGVTYHA